MKKFATCMVAAFKVCRSRARAGQVALPASTSLARVPSSPGPHLVRVAPRYVQRGGRLVPELAGRSSPKRKAAKRKAAPKKKHAKKSASSRPFVIFYRARKSDGLKGRKLGVEFGTSGAVALRKFFEKHPARAHEPGNHVQVSLATAWRKAHG